MDILLICIIVSSTVLAVTRALQLIWRLERTKELLTRDR